MTNVAIGQEIFNLQAHGGISTIWRELNALLPACLPEFTFDPALPADIYLPSYYSPAPLQAKSIVLVFDYIMERYPNFPRFMPDSQLKSAAIARADAVIAISQWTADDVKAFTGKAATVAYPATSLERAHEYAVKDLQHVDHIPPGYVLVVGRRGLYKNVSAYYQALNLLNQQRLDLFTVCAGGESDLTQYETLNQYRGAQRFIKPDDAKLAALYTGATCLVYPSLYEGFGLPVLEAYACGCPVICGSGGALAEINGAALVVDVTRPREIAEALVKMQDPGVRIEHILQGYDVAKQFTWRAMAEQVAAVIREVAERETVNG